MYRIIFIILLSSIGLKAQTWTGSVNSDWNTASNWSNPTSVPNSSSTVIIPGAGINNWPVLASDVQIASLTINNGAQLDVNGYKTTTINFLKINGVSLGVTINNSNASSDIVFEVLGDRGDAQEVKNYIAGTRFNGNVKFNISGLANFYDSYNGIIASPCYYSGNVEVNSSNGNDIYISSSGKSTFKSNLSVNRSFPGNTYLFKAGGDVEGNFSYTSNAGGTTSIGGNIDTEIKGTVNIEHIVDIASSPPLWIDRYGFYMSQITNLIGGGKIKVQNPSARPAEIDDGFRMSYCKLLVNDIDLVINHGARMQRNTIEGNINVIHSKGGYDMRWGGNIIHGNINCNLSKYLAMGSHMWEDGMYVRTEDQIFGNLTIHSSSTSAIFWLNASLYGDLEVNVPICYLSGRFVGLKNTVISGTTFFNVEKLILDKKSGASITLLSNLNISGNADFIEGNIHTGINNRLEFLNGSTYTGGSKLSHVVGAVSKIGNEAFTFPIGSMQSYNPISITPSANSTVSDSFLAQYFNLNPDDAGYNTSSFTGAITKVGKCEYWTLDRLAGNASAIVGLGLSSPCAGTGYVTDLSKVNVVRWNGTTWEDLGNGGTSGTSAEGKVRTLSTVSSFSPFTIGSTDVSLNPLPVKLIGFSVTKTENCNLVKWQTASEINASHFDIEYSLDGKYFKFLESVQSRGMSANHYVYEDFSNLSKGRIYYRLKMLDNDNSHAYSQIIYLVSKEAPILTYHLYPNPSNGVVTLESKSSKMDDLKAVITNAYGIPVKNYELKDQTFSIDLKSYPTGMYLLKLSTGETFKIMKE